MPLPYLCTTKQPGGKWLSVGPKACLTSPGCAEGPSCETEGIPERQEKMFTKSFNFTTELCVDLKTILRSDRKAKTNKDYMGVLTRDSRDHFTFIETQPTTAKRNPQLFRGKYITITRWADGSLHPNFRPMPANTSVEHYAFNVYRELYKALKGLVEKK